MQHQPLSRLTSIAANAPEILLATIGHDQDDLPDADELPNVDRLVNGVLFLAAAGGFDGAQVAETVLRDVRQPIERRRAVAVELCRYLSVPDLGMVFEGGLEQTEKR